MWHKLLKEIKTFGIAYCVLQLLHITETKNFFSLRVTLEWLNLVIIAVYLRKVLKKIEEDKEE